MESATNIEFRQLSYDQLVQLIGWAEKEGWNPGKQDATLFWKTDPNGFYGLFKDDLMIGGGALISYEGAFGSMGLFIVLPEYRGEGYGANLWFKRRDTLLSRLTPGAAIGLDGVVPMQPFYAKGGFKVAFTDLRFERSGASFELDHSIAVYTERDKEELTHYDFTCMGYRRSSFLHPWIQQACGKTFVYRENGNLKGYAVIRQAVTGMRIGPLFADNDFVAESLYKACLTHANENTVYIDTPASHLGAVALLKRYHATPVFECARMYHGTPPPFELNKIYGLTSLELG